MKSHLDIAPCGFFTVGMDGLLYDVNATLCELLHFNKEEILGEKLESIFTLSSRIFYQTHLFPLLKIQGYAEEIFLTLLSKNNDSLPVLLSARKLSEDGQDYLACAFITVNNRKKFEDELVAARKAAENALQENIELNKIKQQLQQQTELLDDQLSLTIKINDDLRQFNQVVTHELQESLRKISIFSNIILDKRLEYAGLSHTVTRLLEATTQLHQVVSGLQQYIWLDESSPVIESLDLNLVFNSAFESIIKEFGLDILSISQDCLSSIEADASQMQLLFYHILVNCVKFRKAEEKASVLVESALIEKNRYNVISGYKYENFVKIDISDKGVGFDSKFKDQVFELFKKLHANEGLGIGLALCKKIVTNHSGSISIDSQLGKGTTLTILLPVRFINRRSLKG